MLAASISTTHERALMPGTQAPPLVLSIQSHVAYGHVGNDAAMLPLQLLGIEPVAVHTVQFSNHTGYGEFKGQVFTPPMYRMCWTACAPAACWRAARPCSRAIWAMPVGEAILAAVQEVRAAQPKAHYLCDPVMGDVGRGVFVRPGIPDFLRKRALSQASVITPNHYEFELLCGGQPLSTVEAATQAARAMLTQLHHSPSALIVITSLRTDDLPADQLATLAVTADKSWLVQTPYIDLHPCPTAWAMCSRPCCWAI
jgi:pyridoxine kinase